MTYLSGQPIRIHFADYPNLIAKQVLRNSIVRRTERRIVFSDLLEYELPDAIDSLAATQLAKMLRIPKLNGWQGIAVYVRPSMYACGDIASFLDEAEYQFEHKEDLEVVSNSSDIADANVVAIHCGRAKKNSIWKPAATSERVCNSHTIKNLRSLRSYACGDELFVTYSNVRGCPWYYPGDETDRWRHELNIAIEFNAVPKAMLLKWLAPKDVPYDPFETPELIHPEYFWFVPRARKRRRRSVAHYYKVRK